MADPEKQDMEDGEVEVIETEEQDDSGAGNGKAGEIATQLMRNPEVLAALQDRLEGMVGAGSGYIQSLPKVVKRRIKALKKLQNEVVKIESKFYEEVHELECKYAAMYAPLFERRRDILSGGVEPTDSDCEWASEDEDDEKDEEETKLANDVEKKVTIEEGKKENDKEEEEPSGVPEFWSTIFKNVDLTSEMIQDHDEPILKSLKDIVVKFNKADPMGFSLEFHFEANEYFSNTILTKEYVMRSEPDPKDPFSFEGPEIIKCKGCTVDWKKGKNVTVKTVQKTQKHKGRGTTRKVTKTVPNDSFFNFFSPPEVPDGDEPDEDTEALLAADYEIGHFIRERIVPRAVLYFTGEALDDDDEYDEEGDEEEGDEYDEDNDADFNPAV
eukprot:GHVU01159279.1.p1 GENE.GHVU01159279.1~~GHVU01159279.1.p1  ORF type:complete len:384 (+),score=96.41 GHVU01159279.1:87-1238(+)